jgi:hypothetical protein
MADIGKPRRVISVPDRESVPIPTEPAQPSPTQTPAPREPVPV